MIGMARGSLSLSEIDLNDYYEKYRPDHTAAMLALCADTGIGSSEATARLAVVFDEHENQLEEFREESDLKKSIRLMKYAWRALFKVLTMRKAF